MSNSDASMKLLHRASILNYSAGFVVGLCIPLLALVLDGPERLSPAFIAGSLFLGCCCGAFACRILRGVLGRHLMGQEATLQELLGERPAAGASLEALERSVNEGILELGDRLERIRCAVEEFFPHYQSLADASRYFSARSEDGLQAAQSARGDVDGMQRKQQEVMIQTETLNQNSQDEAALSRELSASLEEMAGALEHSTSKFKETSRNVDEMVGSIREATAEAEQMAQVTEGTARDLDAIGDALDKLRRGIAENAENSATVKDDAAQGVKVVQAFTQEMGRIDEESNKAISASQRLSRQAVEVAKIIEVIKELVSDTELLAFNAAIIAAKAGAEGRGFSVVAEEIRDLADRTTVSADEIEAIVSSIRDDTEQVHESVASTGHFIGRGKELSSSTEAALRKIVASSSEAASVSAELAQSSAEQGVRARAMIEQAGHNLRSVRAIVETMERQSGAIGRIQAGVGEMKSAADRIARGFDEQVKANREFDRGLSAREEQIGLIFEATRFQMETVERIFDHFGRSESRLAGNAERARIITEEVAALETISLRLRETVALLRDATVPSTEEGAPASD